MTSAASLDANLNDASGVGWPGKLEFERAFAAEVTTCGEAVLEIACGTGRVANTEGRAMRS